MRQLQLMIGSSKSYSEGTNVSEDIEAPTLFWQPPPVRQVKVNVDGGFKHNNKGSFGAVIRDSNVLVLAACFGPIIVSSAIQAEAITMRQGLDLVRLAGFNICVVESDCRELISAVSKKVLPRPIEIYSLLKDIDIVLWSL
ncbi:PREDICTED: uncharacterized protein LOC104601168 [Nelumbo nucifera]|uniref:RNase H type-1 domain-containing protein n=2 Tax=Nelumbo nucifera TaxID=4432 RepID=A0A822YBD8_NELNU|nr:PREDICTED: uncharacterized protein LOC104601168 [Nelumbo nucifera]DAD28376.1 TPA_asm: hypothetical protein HUJ06_029844 [Nelumbo nucifera]